MRGEPFRILLVEDNRADVYLMQKAMEDAGVKFELTVIEDGGSALEFVRGNGQYGGRAIPHLAVIDLSLPKTDGIQVLEAIRATERFAGMRVIVMSSSAVPDPRLKEEHLQVTRYIPKPLDLDEFLGIGAAIRGLLEGYASDSEQ